MLCAAAAITSSIAQAETPAGDRVLNTAASRYSVTGLDATADSNTDTLLVAERLDVALARTDMPVAAGAAAIALLLTNRGNGSEAFRLGATSDGTTPTRFAIDVDGNGRYDAATDTVLADATSPALAPGTTLALLLLAGTAAGFAGTPVTIVAQAVTGSGTPGTTFAGRGDGGGDAVVGATGAQAQLIVAPGDAAAAVLTKQQAVRAPDGSARAIRGAVVTYTLTATFAAAAAGARIDDPVPAGTAYLPGTLSLDGQPLSDAADGDAGMAGPTAIAVALGDVATAAVRTLQFQVQIQ